MPITVPCTKCGINEVPLPKSIEIDPLCPACINNAAILAKTGEPKPCVDCGTHTTKLTSEGLCADCEENAMDAGRYCPGYQDSCSHLRPKGSDLCPSCTRQYEAERQVMVDEGIEPGIEDPDQELAEDGCPGWGTGEDCGNPRMTGGDLCGDCHGARTDHESPRIPF